jgi:hypothetical protein
MAQQTGLPGYYRDAITGEGYSSAYGPRNPLDQYIGPIGTDVTTLESRRRSGRYAPPKPRGVPVAKIRELGEKIKGFGKRVGGLLATTQPTVPVVRQTVESTQAARRAAELVREKGVLQAQKEIRKRIAETSKKKWEEIKKYEKEKIKPITTRIMPEERAEKIGELVEEERKLRLPGVFIGEEISRRVGGAKGFEEMAQARKEAYKEYIKAPFHEPVKFVGTTAVFAAIPGVATGLGRAVKPIASKIPLLGKAGKVVGVGITGIYGYSIGKRVVGKPTMKERGGEFGRILGQEVTPMVLGTYTGLKISQKLAGWWRTRGKEYVPPEQVIEPKVLKGEKTFPLGVRAKHLELFLKSKYRLPGEKQLGVWHATPEAWAKVTKTQVGIRELPGTYVAPSLSAYFLRVSGQEYGLYGAGQLFPTFGTPTALRIYPSKITGVPPFPREKLYQWILKDAPKGRALVPGIKGEVEALIPPETELARVGEQFYTMWKGVRIPIAQYQVAGAAVGVAPAKGVTTLGSLLAYEIPPTTSLITPGTLGVSEVIRERKPEVTKEVEPESYVEPGKVSIVKPSKYKPSKVEIPSYKPSEIKPSSYLPSKVTPPTYYPYQPPKYPTYVPPKYPTYLFKPYPAYKPSKIRTPSYTPYKPTPKPYKPPRYPTSKIIPPLPSIRRKKRVRRLALLPAFQLLVRRRGKWRVLGVPTTKGRALRKGVAFARRTLGVSFQVRPTKVRVRAKDIPYIVPKKIFRKPIRKGKEVLKNPVFIQRGDKDVTFVKGARLATIGEVREIQRARRSKINFLGGKKR